MTPRRGESKVKWETLVTSKPSDTRSTGTLAGVCITKVALSTHRMAAALAAPSPDSSKAVFTLAAGAADILLLAVALTSPGVALLTLCPILAALARPTEAIARVTVEARQTSVTVPTPSITQASKTLAGDVVTVACRTRVTIGAAVAGLAVVSDVQGVAIEAIGTATTMCPFIAHRTGCAGVLLWGQAVLIIVNSCHLAGRTEVV